MVSLCCFLLTCRMTKIGTWTRKLRYRTAGYSVHRFTCSGMEIVFCIYIYIGEKVQEKTFKEAHVVRKDGMICEEMYVLTAAGNESLCRN